MAWIVEITTRAQRTLARLDKTGAKRIHAFVQKRLAGSENPRSLGKPLKGPLGEFWRYRVGDYRLICAIEDNRMVILVLRIAHRREVYR
ncbi:MAG: type II toxin-antitoxin system RelE/ParE family toxin [Synergistota bacterium]|nr:type II toxin-antitoxin system RelE/ParE family toxin [Synergistota bacterium]